MEKQQPNPVVSVKGMRIYLVIFAVLAALAVYFFLSRRSGTYAPSDHDFAVRDTGLVTSVCISGSGMQTEIHRTGEEWRVNGYPARKEAIHGLFILISRLEVEAPVSKSIEERVLGGLGIPGGDPAGQGTERYTGIRIGMSEGREKHYRVYYDSLSGSTFMMLEGSGIAFRVGVRGYHQSNLAGLFRPDPRFWRDNLIFHYLPDEILSVSLLYTEEPGRSFHLTRNDAGEFKIAAGKIPESWESPATEKVRQYLGYFYDVRFEAFLDPEKDTLEYQPDPGYVLKLVLTDRRQRSLELYPIYRTTVGGSRQMDYNILYGRTGEGEDWIVLKYVEVDPLLREFGYF